MMIAPSAKRPEECPWFQAHKNIRLTPVFQQRLSREVRAILILLENSGLRPPKKGIHLKQTQAKLDQRLHSEGGIIRVYASTGFQHSS